MMALREKASRGKGLGNNPQYHVGLLFPPEPRAIRGTPSLAASGANHIARR
jgi:hypothetical protein